MTPSFEFQQSLPADIFNDLLCTQVSAMLREEKTTGYYPMLVIVEPDSDTDKPYQLTVVGLAVDDFEDYRVRRKVLNRLGQTSAKTRQIAVAVFIISEAWWKELKPEEVQNHRAPSEYVDRKEVLFISGQTWDNQTNFARIPIARDEHNYIQLGDPVLMPAGSNLSGQSVLAEEFYRGFMKEIAKPKGFG